MIKKIFLLAFICLSFIFTKAIADQDIKELSLKEFVELAVENDTEFEEILIDELKLKYTKALGLPAGDLVLNIKSQYSLILDQQREEPSASVSLSKLFPYTGAELSADYSTTASLTSDKNTSEFTFEFSQPLAENAFGKSTKLLDKIIGIENDIASFQIIEAYEDYLASTIAVYYNWYEALENWKIAKSSYSENLKLLDNIKEREKNKIAVLLDVNKINLQVLAKKEKLIELEQVYNSALSMVKKSIKYTDEKELVVIKPDLYQDVNFSFESDYEIFRDNSRTQLVLNKIKEKSKLNLDRDLDNLLPSIDLLIGYSVKGKDHNIESEDNQIYAGISFDLPITDQVNNAEYNISKILNDKTQIVNKNKEARIRMQIKDLCLKIEREKQLISIMDQKLQLAEAILKDETENYSFGKVSLNDYIAAVNIFDNNRFAKIELDVSYRKLIIEFLRITDRLIAREDIKKGNL